MDKSVINVIIINFFIFFVLPNSFIQQKMNCLPNIAAKLRYFSLFNLHIIFKNKYDIKRMMFFKKSFFSPFWANILPNHS